MANSLKMLTQVVLGTTIAIHYTVPASTTSVIKKIGLCNTSLSQIAKVTIHTVANGGTVSNINMMVNELELAPKETKFINPDDYLISGFTIRAKSDIDAIVSMQISGVEIT